MARRHRNHPASEPVGVITDTAGDRPAEVAAVLAQRCVAAIGCAAAGVMVADTDHDQDLRAIAWAGTDTRRSKPFARLAELGADVGPAPECYRTGTAVLHPDLHARWPRFAAAARAAGVAAAHALPLQRERPTIGALVLLTADDRALTTAEADTAQGLADVVGLAVLHQRAADDAHRLHVLLRRALDDVTAVHQVKGALFEATPTAAGNPTPTGHDLAGMSDDDLVTAVAAGNRDALAAIYERHAATVWAIARRHCPDHDRALAVTRAVFLRLWRAPHESHDDTLRPWLALQAHAEAHVSRLRPPPP